MVEKLIDAFLPRGCRTHPLHERVDKRHRRLNFFMSDISRDPFSRVRTPEWAGTLKGGVTLLFGALTLSGKDWADHPPPSFVVRLFRRKEADLPRELSHLGP